MADPRAPAHDPKRVAKANEDARKKDPHGLGKTGSAKEETPAGLPTDDRHDTERAAHGDRS